MTCSQDKCKSVFVSWVWLIGVIITIAIPSLVFAFKGGKTLEAHEQKISYIADRLEKLGDIDDKLDKIIERLK